MKLRAILFSIAILVLLSTCTKNSCEPLGCVNGDCVRGECVCDSGWLGQYCNITRSAALCNAIECEHGVCENGICICDSGYTGTQCEQGFNYKYAGKYVVESGSCTLNFNLPDTITIAASSYSAFLLDIENIWARLNCSGTIESDSLSIYMNWLAAGDTDFYLIGSYGTFADFSLQSIYFRFDIHRWGYGWYDRCAFTARRL